MAMLEVHDLEVYYGVICALKGIDFEVKPATCSGVDECKIALLKLAKGVLKENFIEGMICEGGCINGAGCLTHGEKNKAEVIFSMEDGVETGFALFFHNFSTFLGRAGIYLEDLFVLPECRGRGYGTAMLKKLAALAVERGCGRLEWSCLDWNSPSIGFYKALGAVPMEEWTVFRVAGETLHTLAKQDS